MASEKNFSTEQVNDFSGPDGTFSPYNLDTVVNDNSEEICHDGKECDALFQISSVDSLLKNETEIVSDSDDVKDVSKYIIDGDCNNIQRNDASNEFDHCETFICQDDCKFLGDETKLLKDSKESENFIASECLDIDNRSDSKSQEVTNITDYISVKKCYDLIGREEEGLEKCLHDDNANTTFGSSDIPESVTKDEASNNNEIVYEYSDMPIHFEMDSVETDEQITENYENESINQISSKHTDELSFDAPENDQAIDKQNNLRLIPADTSNVNEVIKLSIQNSHSTAEEDVSKITASDEIISEIYNSAELTLKEHRFNKIAIDVRKYSHPYIATVPTIAEKDGYEACITTNRDTIEFGDILGTASPTLRRSRYNNNPSRQDCRLLFNENSDDFLLEDRVNYSTLRDSLDMSPQQHSDAYSSVRAKKDDLPIIDPQIKGSGDIETKCASSKDDLARFTKSIPYKKKTVSQITCKGRRVSFPEDDSRLITSYLEPANPWYQMNDVTTDDISEAYQKSCYHHSTIALPLILQQIKALPVQVGGRIERLSFKLQRLDVLQVECLEEIFKRVQFKTLDFEECSLEDDTAIPLFDMIEFYDSASHLNISCNKVIGFRGWQACARMLKKTPSLKFLDARDTNLNEQHMPIICRVLRIGTKLHTVHLENCNLTGRPLITLAGALRLNDTISDLYLGDNRLGTNDCIHLGNLVGSNKTLKLLDLRNNNIQDTGCNHICKAITDQQKNEREASNLINLHGIQIGLVTLNLWNNYLTINSIPHLSNMLSVSITLQTLNLGRNYLTSEGILLIKSALIRNRTLVRLGLQSTRLGNEGAVALAECVVDNPVISRIDLRENSIQVAGLMALSRSLALSSNIVQLDLDSNPRAEPTPDLLDQHIMLQKEIKSICQKNQVEIHSKNDCSGLDSQCIIDNSFGPDPRKISLTCETVTTTPIAVPASDKREYALAVAESKRYWSPAPSPSISPCPSPSLSPSPSPMPSPLRNRFKVFKVTEDLLSTSAPATLSHSMSGSLPALNNNRFLSGKRFTVTNVSDPAAPIRAMSSPSLISAVEGPTIVVSSPNISIRGFDVEDQITVQKERSNSLDILSKPIIESPTSDDVFEACPATKANPERKQAVYNSPCFDSLMDDVPLAKAPLAIMEAGSFDSDSEDSELTTQSSDSTRSDEVKISSAEQIVPLVAWEAKMDKSSSPIKSAKEDNVTS